MAVRSNIKKVTSPDGTVAQQGRDASVTTDGGAIESGPGRPVDVSVGLVDVSIGQTDLGSGGAAGGQAAPSVRVMGLLGQMRQIAMRGTCRELSDEERCSMGRELKRLAQKIDSIADELTRTTPRGENPANYDSVEAFFESVFADETLDGLLDPFSTYSLGVDCNAISVDSPRASRMAFNAIGDAMTEMDGIHQNGASTEAHLDAALERLAAFVESIDPDSELPRSPSAALESAERVRLYLMSGRGVGAVRHSNHLQKSVTALLQ